MSLTTTLTPAGYVVTQDMALNNSVVAIGDSITAQSWQTSSVVSVTKSLGWLTQVQALLNGRFDIADNLAVAGKTSAQVISEQLPQALASGAGWLFCAPIGTNSIAGGVSAASVIADIKTIMQAGLGMRKRVVLGTILPRNGVFSVAMATEACKVNNWLRNVAAYIPGVSVIDFARVLLDTSSLANANAFQMTAAYTPDGTHPNALGANRMAIEAARVLDPVFPVFRCLPGQTTDGANGDTDNLAQNSMMLGTAGVVNAPNTGVVPTSYSLTNSGAASAVGSIVTRASVIATDPNAVGNFTKLVVTGATATTDSVYLGVPLAFSAAYRGRRFVFEVEVNAAATSGTLFQLRAALAHNTDPLSVEAMALSTDNLGITAFAGVLRSRVFTMPAGATFWSLNLFAGTSVGGSANVHWGNPVLREISS